METKRAQVHMLPSNKNNIATLILKHNSVGTLYFNHKMKDTKTLGNWQHLYVTTDEEPKEGDWVYSLLSNSIFQVEKFVLGHVFEDRYTNISIENVRKIIATTDKSLKLPCNCLGMSDKVKCDWMCKTHRDYMLPQPSQAFIEKFVKEYNTGIKTTWETDLQLKVDSYNTITIHPIKDSWTEKKFMEFKQLADNIIIPACNILPNTYDEEIDEYFNWIKENL